MNPALLPKLLLCAWLLPLVSFTLIVFFGPRMGKAGRGAGVLATGAILGSALLSLTALFGVWLPNHGASAPGGHATESHAEAAHDTHGDDHGHAEHAVTVPVAYSGDWYTLGQFGKLRLTIGYYIDSLTLVMFCMVTFIATCIHFYANGYMHDELHDVTDYEVLVSKTVPHDHGHDAHDVHVETHDEPHDDTHGDAHHGDHPAPPSGMEYLHRRGRFHRFFQYLSLFCFSMLGIVIAGNIAMVFVFWELVGICSYFLIGFYIERHSASTAANKAFIANRVGDFGMIIGLMALFAALGTFSFADWRDDAGNLQPGLFSQVRPAENNYQLTVPDGMVKAAAAEEIAEIVVEHDPSAAASEIEARVPSWKTDWKTEKRFGQWAYILLVVAGIGIFCGCVGKSAQFPLQVWLPDAMEGPTPVSALVHSATMVAAGVYLVGRFYPMFTPEVLVIIGVIGGITLFLAATIAIVATDIKRVLAYSTISQLGYMMLSLGVGGWVGGMMHLITHAFFKSLLFMCSGSVIHACHTNEMTKMGGLRHKMPYTAYTMLVGCLAIAGFGIPFVIGTSGYYSKDAMLAQAFSFRASNSAWHGALVYVLAAGAFITAFYMFRLWFMTFAGKPRDKHVYEHAHESPKVMYVPLVVLAIMAIGVAWDFLPVRLVDLLEQARPAGTSLAMDGQLWPNVHHPAEHDSHNWNFHSTATMVAFGTAMGGILLAVLFYGVGVLSPSDVARQFKPIYTTLRNKWYFDELYNAIFVQPTLFVSRRIAEFDKVVIDGFINWLAKATRVVSLIDDLIDRYFVDGIINWCARQTFNLGIALRSAQTGNLRQYVMFIVIGTVALFVLISYFLNYAVAG
jgi:NADH:ubiquinone oxidoreductase subunit 5 (subunit L)/multisubunit Na+/H+ antiporter MnhA subunit